LYQHENILIEAKETFENCIKMIRMVHFQRPDILKKSAETGSKKEAKPTHDAMGCRTF
jgi:hypothetical protein